MVATCKLDKTDWN